MRAFARIFGARKNTTQLAKYPRVLYVKPSNKMYLEQVSVRNTEKSRMAKTKCYKSLTDLKILSGNVPHPFSIKICLWAVARFRDLNRIVKNC